MEFEALSVFAGFVTVLWGMGMYMLTQQINNAVSNLPRNEHELTLSEELRQQIYDLLIMGIDDSIGALKPPTAFDHAVGAFSTFMQHKMRGMVPPNVFEDLTQLAAEHGNPSEEENITQE